MLDFGKLAILCIHKNHVSSIEKIEGFKHHIQYYIELSKRDAIIQEVLSHYNVPYLIENPTEVQRTIHQELVSVGIETCLILSFDPQITMPTTIFFAIMPEQINDFQKNELEKLKNLSNYEFCDFGIFNSASNTFEDMMQEEDSNKANFYLLGNYIERAYTGVKRVND